MPYIRYSVAGSLMMALLLWIALASPVVRATDSYARFYGSLQGLNAGEIRALAQDQTGFIWIGSQGGLLRFDGNRFMHFATQEIPLGVSGLWWDAHSGLLIQSERNHAFVENHDNVQALIGPDGKPVMDMETAAFDRSGQLWAVIDDALWRRDLAFHWMRVPVARFDRERPRRLSALERGIALITDKGAWRLDAGGHAQLLLRSPDLFAAAGGSKHSLWLVSHEDGSLWRQVNRRFVLFRHIKGRVLDMRYRGDTLWVSVDRYLLAIARDDSEFSIDVNHGLPSGGPLLVDREGSLWVGTFVGLQQYPEPDTRRWSELDGLPWQHAYGVAAAGGQVWVSTWGGPVHFDIRQPTLRMVRGMATNGAMCADSEGRMWQAVHGHLVYWRDGRYTDTGVVSNSTLGLGGCSRALDGGVWLATSLGVFHVASHSDHAQSVLAAVEPTANYFTDLVWQAQDGTLWTASNNTLCHYDLTELHAQLRACTQQPFEDGAFRVVELAPSHYWLSTTSGLYAFDGHTARLLAGNDISPSRRFKIIEPAVSGGYWAVAPGALDRIEPCSNCVAGFRVVESLGDWQGVPPDSTVDIVELENGDLWIAGNRGVFRVPVRARTRAKPIPPVVLVNVSVDGHEQSVNARLQMSPTQKQFSVEFAALTFRDRSLLRYRFRSSAEQDWSVPSTNPDLQLIAPKPGDYQIGAQASLDGVHWSVPASYAFSVAPPWHETMWARLVLLLVIIVVVALIMRLWLEYKLRLERQRVQIAMDLHDELGSTLGSIGMLAGAMTHGNLEDPEQRRMLGEISDAVARLGGALRSVVWSMRQPKAGLRQLLTEIGDQAKHLFPGAQPAVKVSGPGATDDAALDSGVRRHVLMVVLEAMHNAARHAHAHEVTLRLQQVGRRAWRMEIHDDGIGFDTHTDCCGSGLESMRRRARLIHAQLAIYSEPGAGTTITLDFHPDGGLD